MPTRSQRECGAQDTLSTIFEHFTGARREDARPPADSEMSWSTLVRITSEGEEGPQRSSDDEALCNADGETVEAATVDDQEPRSRRAGPHLPDAPRCRLYNPFADTRSEQGLIRRGRTATFALGPTWSVWEEEEEEEEEEVEDAPPATEEVDAALDVGETPARNAVDATLDVEATMLIAREQADMHEGGETDADTEVVVGAAPETDTGAQAAAQQVEEQPDKQTCGTSFMTSKGASSKELVSTNCRAARQPVSVPNHQQPLRQPKPKPQPKSISINALVPMTTQPQPDVREGTLSLDKCLYGGDPGWNSQALMPKRHETPSQPSHWTRSSFPSRPPHWHGSVASGSTKSCSHSDVESSVSASSAGVEFDYAWEAGYSSSASASGYCSSASTACPTPTAERGARHRDPRHHERGVLTFTIDARRLGGESIRSFSFNGVKVDFMERHVRISVKDQCGQIASYVSSQLPGPISVTSSDYKVEKNGERLSIFLHKTSPDQRWERGPIHLSKADDLTPVGVAHPTLNRFPAPGGFPGTGIKLSGGSGRSGVTTRTPSSSGSRSSVGSAGIRLFGSCGSIATTMSIPEAPFQRPSQFGPSESSARSNGARRDVPTISIADSLRPGAGGDPAAASRPRTGHSPAGNEERAQAIQAKIFTVEREQHQQRRPDETQVGSAGRQSGEHDHQARGVPYREGGCNPAFAEVPPREPVRSRDAGTLSRGLMLQEVPPRQVDDMCPWVTDDGF